MVIRTWREIQEKTGQTFRRNSSRRAAGRTVDLSGAVALDPPPGITRIATPTARARKVDCDDFSRRAIAMEMGL